MTILKTSTELQDAGYIKLNGVEAAYFAKRWRHDWAKVMDACSESGARIKHDTGTLYDSHNDKEIWLNMYGRKDNAQIPLFEQVQ